MSDNTSASNRQDSPTDAHRTLRIGGIAPFTATDFPGELAAVFFVQGCPWRCGYCHNPHLQPRTEHGAIPWNDALEFLHKRVALIDAVVFSGGEPVIDPAIAGAIWTVRKMGFKVGLHSAGIYPQRLTEVLPWLDWIGLDIKAPFEHYESVTGVPNSGEPALASAQAVLASGIDYEFRTTIHPALLPEDAIAELAQTLAGMGVKNYALQVFRRHGCADAGLNAALEAGYPSKELIHRVSGMFEKFILREN